jgi:signal transduction histidine kinase
MTHLTHSLGVYQTIRERIIALEGDIDEATLADTLEGLTDIHEVLAAIVRSALLDEALAEGLKDHIQRLQERLQRLTERGTERRRIARDAMVEVGHQEDRGARLHGVGALRLALTPGGR